MMFQIQYGYDEQTKQFVATIPELNNISDFGSTIEEAEYNVSKAAELYLEELESAPKEIQRQKVHSYIHLSVPHHDEAQPA